MNLINQFIPLANPDIQSQDIDAVVAVLTSGMLVQGKEVLNFENEISSYKNCTHSIAVSNGTATMHMTLIALQIGPGDEVIVPAFSYVATANVVELVGATPVFVDININTFNIDVDQVESKITSKTKAIIAVHEFGLACDIETVMQIANKHKLLVIEDAACALGAKQKNKFVGTFGIAGSFSFHPRKSITSGEGGLITTNDNALAEKLRTLRNHGIFPNSNMDFVAAGFNYRLTDIQGALLNSQFKRFEQIIAKKSELAKVYLNEINNPKIILPKIPKDRNHTWQTFHILLDESIIQEDIILFFRENNVGVNYGAQCIPAQTFYKEKYALDYLTSFPNAYKAYKYGIALPIYEKLDKKHISYISNLVNQI